MIATARETTPSAHHSILIPLTPRSLLLYFFLPQWMSQSLMFRDFEDLESEEERETVALVTDKLQVLLGHESLDVNEWGLLPKGGGRKTPLLEAISAVQAGSDYGIREE